jgi:hypothetical protein
MFNLLPLCFGGEVNLLVPGKGHPSHRKFIRPLGDINTPGLCTGR